MDIPHNEKRFPGYDKENPEEWAEMLREHVFGGHVSDYMTHLQEEDEDRYKKQVCYGWLGCEQVSGWTLNQSCIGVGPFRRVTSVTRRVVGISWIRVC